MQDDRQLVDLIYEAAVVAEQWPSVLGELSNIANGAGGLIFTRIGLENSWLASPGAAEEVHAEAVRSGWMERNQRGKRLFAAHYPGFMNDLNVFTPEEMDNDPYFSDFLRPRGFGWGAATAIEVPSGDLIAFDIERWLERGPVERAVLDRLDALRPHLARASIITNRLWFERLRSATETLEAVGLPATVLGRSGRPQIANRLFTKLMPEVAVEGGKRLAFRDARADMLFGTALDEASSSDGRAGVRSIPIQAYEDRPAMIVHLVPIRRSASDIFSTSSSIVVVTPVDRGKVPSAEVLQGLFDLTPAEARAARGIAGGQTLDEIARTHGLSRETVRSQLRSTLAKTGMRRQVDLARLLAGISTPPL